MMFHKNCPFGAQNSSFSETCPRTVPLPENFVSNGNVETFSFGGPFELSPAWFIQIDLLNCDRNI